MTMENLFSVKGKKILICGNDAKYLHEIAKGLDKAMALVYVCGPHYISGLNGFEFFELQCDTEENLLSSLNLIKNRIGNIDCFIWADTQKPHPGWDHEFEVIDETLKRHMLGLVLCVKHIGGFMAEKKNGSIIVIADYSALVGLDVNNYQDNDELFNTDFSLEYGFIQGGYINYTRQAAGYLGQFNVRCNVVACAPLKDTYPSEFEQKFIKHSHIKKMAEKEDILSAVIYLSSDASKYVTGTVIPVDGGYTAK